LEPSPIQEKATLTTVTIGNYVSSIMSNAFYGCISLTTITSQRAVPPTANNNCFYNVNKTTCTVNVPPGTKCAYKDASGWEEFLNILDGTSTICNPENDNCSSATTLTCGTMVSGTLTGATRTTNITYSSHSDKKDVFYKFTATNIGNYTITLNNFLGDKDLFLYSDCNATSSLTSSTYGGSTETITRNCTAGEYIIRITDYDGTGGTFNIKVDCPQIYTITFDPQGGNVTPPTLSITQGQAVGTLPTPTRDCYTFGGWFTQANGGGTQYYNTTVPTGNITLFAKWTIITYTLTFNAQSGSVSPNSQTVSCGSSVGTLPTPTRNCYNFDGWFTGTNGSGVQYTNTTVPTGNITLFAKWTIITYTLTFDAQGGSVSPSTQNVNCGSSVGTLPIPARNGYAFGGWFTQINGGGTQYSNTTVPTSDIILYAKWQETSGIDDILSNSISLYPNPVKEELIITSENRIEKIEICDIAGRAVETRLIASLQGNATINVSALPQGVYLVKIYTDKGIITKKVIKN